jgi:hypothetical protein
MTHKDKEPNSKNGDLEYFFSLYTDTGSKEDIEQSEQKNKSTKEGKTIIKIILIQRRNSNSDIWICNSCTLTGGRWFMEKHPCKQNINSNFAKVAQRFQDYF